MQRNAGRALALQRGHAVADLLETGAKAPAQPLDIVAVIAAGLEEGRIGHDQRGGEIGR